MPEIMASTGHGDYPILIQKGALKRLGEFTAASCRGRQAFIVTDEQVGRLYLETARLSLVSAGFQVSVGVIPPGESSKSPEQLMTLYEQLHAAGMSRSDPVIALGGGVVGDLAGLAASTWLRGLPLIQVPTTLLAQVDASIGGKTAIDLPFGKNLIGTFYQPKAVLMDPALLRTLSRERMAEGMAEVIKYGMIRDLALFEQIENRAYDLEWVLEHCVRIKTAMVAADELDTGERMLLNFGHTVGHAIEKLTGYTTYTHGEAVALGMLAAVRLGEMSGHTSPGTAQRLRSLLEMYQLPVRHDLSAADIIDAIRSDKKFLAGRIYFVLLHEIGQAFLYPITFDQLADHLQEVLGND